MITVSIMNLNLLAPMITMAALTFVVGGLLFFIRVREVRSGRMKIKYFRTYNEGNSTDRELKVSQHFSNLFEFPVLFYAACLLGLILPVQGNGIVAASWVFVAARVAHAIAHIGPSRLLPRMVFFLTGVFAALAMWVMVAGEAARR